jgi:glycosyltransferase involved in cell wall biosynthesis
MKIAVLNNCVPFVTGGAEYLADTLAETLRAHGHEAAVFKLPFQWKPPEKIVEAMLACRLIRLDNVDRVIALKFPVYYVPHPNKVLWLLHQFRQAYDLWGTEFQDLPDDAEGHAVRDAIVRADAICLREARAIYTNSHVTHDRLRKFNHIESSVLYPPLKDSGRFHTQEYGDFLFYPSRLTAGKRQTLVVEALRHTKTPVRLVLAGSPESAATLRDLAALIEQFGLSHRVTLRPTFIDDAEKVDLFARALACVYTPVDEDSYGYVTLEAFHARKPVISCVDSGGVSIVVRPGETGYLTEPTPEALARAMDELYRDRKRARAMGEAGRRLLERLNISWNHVVERLTA